MPSSESFNFYPRPPRGERRGRPSGRTLKKPFLSTPSARRATCGALRRGLAAALFLSTPSARRATYHEWYGRIKDAISIHALREEGDNRLTSLPPAFILFLSTPSARRATCGGGVPLLAVRDFYPRPPRGGRPVDRHASRCFVHISIHALREEGDTLRRCGSSLASRFLSTPSARRATCWLRGTCPPHPISIHALREEGDAASTRT